VVHKAFQRYTVRKKQGGTQAAKDNQSGTNQPKSIGSSLRRQEAVRFDELVVEFFDSWRTHLDECSLLFIFAPSANLHSFFHKGSPLVKSDPRLRKIPFNLRRPSFAECGRVHKVLTTVEVASGIQRPVQEPLPVIAEGSADDEAKKKKKKKKKKNTQQEAGKEDLGDADPEDVDVAVAVEQSASLRTDPWTEAITAGDEEALLRAYAQEDDEADGGVEAAVRSGIPLVALAVRLKRQGLLMILLQHEDINEVDPEDSFRSALHVACAQGHSDVIEVLLEQGANPSLADTKGFTPYNLCKGKQARLLLRRFAASNPGRWEYAFPPLEEEDEEKALLAKKAQKEKKKQKEKDKRERVRQEQAAQRVKEEAVQKEREAQAAAVEREARIKAMTPRERAMEAVNRRMETAKGSAPKCDNLICAKSLTRMPFEWQHFKYCSTQCLRIHRDGPRV
jgi:hypothetical protein